MSTKKKDFILRLLIDGKQVEASLPQVDKQLKSLRTRAAKVSDSIAKWSVIATGFNSALQIGSRFLGKFAEAAEAYKVQEQAEKQLATALGFTSQRLLDRAAALQQVTTFGDESIIRGQSLLAAFVKEEDQIDLVTESVLDLAAAKGMDLNAAFDLVSKTLGSSTNALSRYGVKVEGTVGSSERLNSLIGNLNDAFGGQARALAETDSGKVTQAQNQLGDSLEKVGKVFTQLYAPAMRLGAAVVSDFTDFLIPTETNLEKVKEAATNQKVEFDSLVLSYNRLNEKETKTNAEKQKLKEVIETMNSKYGAYLGNINLEKDAHNDVATAINNARTQLAQKVKQEILYATQRDLLKEIADAEIKMMQIEADRDELISKYGQKERDTWDEIADATSLALNGLTVAQKEFLELDQSAERTSTSLNEAKQKLTDFENTYSGLLDGENTKTVVVKTPTTSATPTQSTAISDYLTAPDTDAQNQENQDFGDAEFEAELERIAKLREAKNEYAESESQRLQREAQEKEIANMAIWELDNALVMEKQRLADIEKAITSAKTQEELDQLKKLKDYQGKRIDMINEEKNAIVERAKTDVQNLIMQYDANKTFAENLGGVVRQRIKQSIAEAVASQIASVIDTIPFPFNLVAAPAAAFAVSALFEELIPAFATGTLDFAGGRALVGERGAEIVELPRGSNVIPNPLVKDYVHGMNGGGNNAMVVEAINQMRAEMKQLKFAVAVEDIQNGLADYNNKGVRV